MLDPTTLAAILASSIKLLESGLKLAIWDGWTTYPTQDRLTWLAKLLGLAGEAISKAGEVLKHVAPASARPEQATHLWAIHVACFGEALAVHWGGNREVAGRVSPWGRWFAPSWVRERAGEVEAAFKFALGELERIPTLPLPRDTWLAAPTASPMYRALWNAFVHHEVASDAGPLLPREQDGDVQAFERAFERAFREALARGGNAELRALLLDGQPRGEALRQLLVAEMAAWRHKHVFAGVDTSEGLPEMPLEKTYVEPTAEVQLGEEKRVRPVLALLEDLLAEHRVIYVSGDFGMGKSLTAQTLSWRWATAYLDPHSDVPSIDRIFPVHVRCGETYSIRGGLDAIVRRALKRAADAVGVSVRPDDAALAPPPSEQRAVVLFDGLDELVMTADQTKDLIRELLDHATERHRYIVFSRPEALPQLDGEHGARTIPHVKLQGFDAAQIDDWLWAWPKEAPRRDQLEARGLAELAKVPILLFMLALTWRTYASRHDAIPRVQIYEAFFDMLATGKYERGGDAHPLIRTPAEQARDVLVDLGELSPWHGKEEGRRRAVEAIRRLMDRVAWEALRREFAGETLSRRHVEYLLADELHLPDSTLEQVRIGLLLSMQAQLVGGSHQFFFGHRSFLEFAVARYWEQQLRRLCSTDRRNCEELEETLTGAIILERGSRIFPFLCEMLDAWSNQDHRRLLEWARMTVHDETIRPSRAARRPTFRNDQRTLVRQAGLAIGCYAAQRLGEPFDISDGSVLLIISTWWIVSRRNVPMIEAPGCRTDERAQLTGACLAYANLSGADLSDAEISGADLSLADLSNANLSGANLSCAFLEGADLSGANLSGANLNGAFLHGANLDGADLQHAELHDARLDRKPSQGVLIKI